jgi:hypothetical protein
MLLRICLFDFDVSTHMACELLIDMGRLFCDALHDDALHDVKKVHFI